MTQVPDKYIQQFRKWMHTENDKLNRIMQDDLQYFKKKIPKKYQNLIVASIHIM